MRRLIAACTVLAALAPIAAQAHPGHEAPHEAPTEPPLIVAPTATHVAKPTRVPMEGAASHVIIDVTIDGKGPFKMVLDTGAATTVLGADLVAELGLTPTGTTRIGDPSNPHAVEVDRVTLGAVEVGGARFEGVQAVGQRGESLVARLGARGVLGLPTFRNCLLTIDYPKRQVEIAPGALPKVDGKSVLALDSDLIAEIDVDVAGRPARAHLDIGNSSSLIVPGAWEADLKTKGEKRKGHGMRASGPVEFTIATLDGDLTIGEHVLHDPEVRFDAKLNHVNIGYGVLRGFALTLDQKNARLKLVPGAITGPAPGSATVAAPPPGARRLGASLAIGPTSAEIQQVAPGSVADGAGLVAGDTIVAVDGAPVSDDAIRAALTGRGPVTLRIRRGDREFDVVLFSEAKP